MSMQDRSAAARGEGDGGAPGPVRAMTTRLRARLHASPWHPLLARAGLLVVALVVLAWIGRAATAATPPPAPGGILSASASSPLEGSERATATAPGAGASLASPPTPDPPPPCTPAHAGATSRATPEAPVYLNHASAEELRRLPGAGPKRAQSILALRERMGRFRRVEDLLRVKGVGRSMIRKWRPLVRLDAPPQLTADAGAPE